MIEVSASLKRTPLFECHQRIGGRMVDFGGWALPVYYTSIIQEHQHVRAHCGIFDVSHLGEFHLCGKGAFQFLQYRITNDMRKLSDGKILYSLLCDAEGRTLDDILIYQSATDNYYLVVNASNIVKDLEALKRYAPASVSIDDESDQTAAIAIQGPESESILEKLFGFSLSRMDYYCHKEEQISGKPVWISRSGYTGEDGFEIFCSGDLSVDIWERLMREGKPLGILPAGLGARNTLRLEAGNVLYGHELDRTTTPLEARLGFAVSFDKGSFVGGDSLRNQKAKGVKRKLIGFKMQEKSVARDGYAIFSGDKRIGHVTSGSYSPTLGCNIGMGYVATGYENAGQSIQIEIHGRRSGAEIVRRPFVPLKHRS